MVVCSGDLAIDIQQARFTCQANGRGRVSRGHRTISLEPGAVLLRGGFAQIIRVRRTRPSEQVERLRTTESRKCSTRENARTRHAPHVASSTWYAIFQAKPVEQLACRLRAAGLHVSGPCGIPSIATPSSSSRQASAPWTTTSALPLIVRASGLPLFLRRPRKFRGVALEVNEGSNVVGMFRIGPHQVRIEFDGHTRLATRQRAAGQPTDGMVTLGVLAFARRSSRIQTTRRRTDVRFGIPERVS